MKSLMLACSFALTAILSLQAQSNIPQPTHEIAKVAPDPFSLPQLSGEGFYYFNGNGDLYEEKFNHWNGISWELSSRTYITLNASGQPTLRLGRVWDANTGMLVDNYRITSGYQANGLKNFEKRERWDMTQGVWKTEQIDLITYNSNDKVQESTNQYYTDGVLSGGNRNIYSFDGFNRIAQSISQYWENGTWINSGLGEYTYTGTDENNYVVYYHNWDASILNWGPVFSRNTLTSTPLQRVSLSENFDGLNWLLRSRYIYDYNTDGQLTTSLNENWDEALSIWKPFFRVNFTFNPDQSEKGVEVYNRDNATDIFYLWIVVDYDYGNYPVATSTPALQPTLSIFPNPTSDFVQVALEGKGMSNLSLLDLHGKVVVSTATASNTAQISLTGQPAGTYLLRVEQGGAIKIIPVVKE